MRVLEIVVAVVLLQFLPTGAESCSTFFLSHEGHMVFGKNYDWNVDVGFLLVNKRGVSKKAAVGEPNAVRWTSEYGSVTFNQYGRELPSGGMNETGLVIELMWLDATEYPEPDRREAIGNMQWIQYQLDTAASVREVIESDAKIRVSSSGSAKIHYLVADRSGRCASVEFLGGRMVVRDTDSMPVPVLTNHPYDVCADYIVRFDGFGGDRPVEYDRSSLGRFLGAANRVRNYDGSEHAIDYAFDTLHMIDQGDYTKWNIVYDLEGLTVHFSTERRPGRKRLPLARLDFSCLSPVMLLDVNTELSGDVSAAMSEYSTTANRRLIGTAFGQTPFLKNVPRYKLDQLARYPESTTCEHEVGAR